MKSIVDSLIKKIYGKPNIIIEEAPVFYGRADLLYLYNEDPFAIAVELKIRDWKKGLRQALRNLFYAKYSFLAIQWKRTRTIDLDAFAKYGIGVIAVNGDAKIVLEPKESKMFFQYKKIILRRLREQLDRDVAHSHKSALSGA